MTIKVDPETFLAFDLDDTLYSEVTFLESAFRSIANFVDQVSPNELYGHMLDIYRNGGNTFDNLIEMFPEKDLTRENLLHLYRNHYPEITLREGVLDMFEKIMGKQGKIGVITNGRSITQRNKISALGIEKYLSEVIISEEFGYEKPDARIYKFFMKKYAKHRFFCFGDNARIDFITPKSMNWFCIGIKNIANIYSESYDHFTNAYLPHWYINNFNEVQIE